MGLKDSTIPAALATTNRELTPPSPVILPAVPVVPGEDSSTDTATFQLPIIPVESILIAKHPIEAEATTITMPVKKKQKIKGQGLSSKKVRAAQQEEDPSYSFAGGLCKVAPYHYTYSTYAKGRWLGRTVLDVVCDEFNFYRQQIHFRWAIERGEVLINGKIVSPEYLFENSDLMETLRHRHEPPVSDKPIEIVADTEDLLIVSKPCSIPVHPCGKYRHNSLTHLLKYQMGYNSLFLVNRIDRLTSGLVLIAKTKEKASEMGALMMDRNISKTYLARVRGEFPDGVIECHEPIGTVSAKLGIQAVMKDGKPATTIFTRESFNGITSVVKCEPKTGRTHQIRVHLQYLGYPIANDPHYNSEAWGNEMGKGGIESDFTEIISGFHETVFPGEYKSRQDEAFKGCVECVDQASDPLPEQITLWLHSLRYEGGDGAWSFESNRPDWAADDFKGDADIEERFWKNGGRWDGKIAGDFSD